MPTDAPAFAERLRFLIENVHPRHRGPYSRTEIVDLIRRSGGTLTTGYLSQLLSGDRKNPGVAIVTQIAEFFRVPVDYFGSAESYLEIRRHIEWIVSLRDSGTDQLAARTTSDPRDALSIGLREIRRNAGDTD